MLLIMVKKVKSGLKREYLDSLSFSDLRKEAVNLGVSKDLGSNPTRALLTETLLNAFPEVEEAIKEEVKTSNVNILEIINKLSEVQSLTQEVLESLNSLSFLSIFFKFSLLNKAIDTYSISSIRVNS